MNELIEAIRDLAYELKRYNDSSEQTVSDEVLNTEEAALFLGKTRQTIRRWAKDGRIQTVERGCKRGFLKSELTRIKRTTYNTLN